MYIQVFLVSQSILDSFQQLSLGAQGRLKNMAIAQSASEVLLRLLGQHKDNGREGNHIIALEFKLHGSL